MPHRDRENMWPASCELAGVLNHTMNCPAAGAETGDEISVLRALLSDAVRDEVVMAEGEFQRDQDNRRGTRGRKAGGRAGEFVGRPASDKHNIRAFGIAREELWRDGPSAGSTRARRISEYSGSS
jgi:hypothetical protein